MELKNNKKVVAIVQARSTSDRLPNKILKKIGNQKIIDLVIGSLKKSKKIDKIIVAIPNNYKNIELKKYLIKKKYNFYLGSEKNVLSRYYLASKKYNADIIIRITSDCPLVDFKIIDLMLSFSKSSKYDVITNVYPPTFPDGLDVEIFNFKTLKKTYNTAKKDDDKEHVTKFMYDSKLFKIKNIKNNEDLSIFKFSVDDNQDLLNLREIKKKIGISNLNWKIIIKYLKKNKKYSIKFMKIKRNIGSILKTGPKVWQRATQIIPGGNMLKSKNPEMFLPNLWPTYFSKTSGCAVWDLDNKKYYDLSLMAVGTNILGYSNKEVDRAVLAAVKKGNMSTFNCKEEVELAEKMIEIHPWSDMVKFCRTGGEASAVAVRIARAATSKEKIAVCGYHGWHDWYLATNLKNNSNLDSHLFQNLKIKGVPKSLSETSYSFNFNSIEEFKKVIKKPNIAAVIMEVSRNYIPNKRFLSEIRKICSKKNIILIFDECTSGFRETYGGLHKKYNIIPDLAVFGKALGNGYAITSVIGKRKYMEFANQSFISSTFWTERIGYVAALKTLEIMKKQKSWKIISNKGDSVRKNWNKLSKKYNIKIKTYGIRPLPRFEIISDNWSLYKTFITQEMLKNGLLATDTIYISVSHTGRLLKKYFHILDKLFKVIKDCESNKSNIHELLDTDLAVSNFRRMN